VADSTLKPTSAFSHLEPFSSPSLSIEPRENLTMASFAAGKGRVQALTAAVRQVYGVELPTRPERVVGNGIAFVWLGPDQWLAIADRASGRDLEVELKQHLAGLASVVDQSDGRVVVRVSGPLAREVLAKGIPIDLHPRTFALNAAAITHASHIGVLIWRIDDAPTFELAMFRSYADSFAHWLLEATRSTVPDAA
jgi:heterotetrameric sarcosine oxidase gamma subunit